MIKPQTCPICDRPLEPNAASESRHFPFCSQRCQQVDFFRWCEGEYAVVEPLDPRRHDLEGRLDELLDE